MILDEERAECRECLAVHYKGCKEPTENQLLRDLWDAGKEWLESSDSQNPILKSAAEFELKGVLENLLRFQEARRHAGRP